MRNFVKDFCCWFCEQPVLQKRKLAILLSQIVSHSFMRCSKIFEKIPQKTYTITDVFLEIFLKSSEQLFCRTFPFGCFSNSLKSPGKMTFISFQDTLVFSGYFSLWLGLLLDCLLYRKQISLRRNISAMEIPGACIFFILLKKHFFLFGGELLLR